MIWSSPLTEDEVLNESGWMVTARGGLAEVVALALPIRV